MALGADFPNGQDTKGQRVPQLLYQLYRGKDWRKLLCPSNSLPPTPASLLGNPMPEFRNFHLGWNTASEQKWLLSQSWLVSVRTRANPHISSHSIQTQSQEQHYSLMQTRGLAMVPGVSPTSTRRREVDLLHCPGIGSRPRQLQDANKNVPCLAGSPLSAR